MNDLIAMETRESVAFPHIDMLWDFLAAQMIETNEAAVSPEYPCISSRLSHNSRPLTVVVTVPVYDPLARRSRPLPGNVVTVCKFAGMTISSPGLAIQR